VVHVPIARLTTEEGQTGFGVCRATPDEAQALLGVYLDEIVSPTGGVAEPWRRFEYPLWDLAGQLAGLPIHALVAGRAAGDQPFRVPCYDTSLYFDDLHLAGDEEAADLIAAEAQVGLAEGHRAFKIKIGRGARHLPLEEGTRRDVAVVRAVRRAVGPAAVLLLDANDGYNLNLTKRVLAETADCSIAWIEEPFHEDAVLYADLHDWLARENLPVLIADGEGDASPRLLDWAREGVVDVVQYDIFAHGLTHWLDTGRQLDAWGRRSAPHHYGGYYGNYAAGHLAGAIRGFAYVEWDEAKVPGVDASSYAVRDGHVVIGPAPGFGLTLDDGYFRARVAAAGYQIAVDPAS
jgi:L-alanine-DL-glutamate epimerase-like enolase superfamily enzyme